MASKTDFKVTPYTIVNYTSYKLKVQKRALEKRKTVISNLKEYEIAPGDQIDYEVDYEEEAHSMTKINNDEFIRK